MSTITTGDWTVQEIGREGEESLAAYIHTGDTIIAKTAVAWPADGLGLTMNPTEMMANAQAIAAVPKLLAAYEAMRQSMADYGPALGPDSPFGDVLPDEILAQLAEAHTSAVDLAQP